MNDDEKKPVKSDENGDMADKPHEDDSTEKNDTTADMSDTQHDAAVSLDDLADKHDDSGDDLTGEKPDSDKPKQSSGGDEFSDLDRELGRIEGIETVKTPATQDDEADDDTSSTMLEAVDMEKADEPVVSKGVQQKPVDVTKPDDLKSSDEADEKDNPYIKALRTQGEQNNVHKSKTGLVAGLLTLLLLVAVAGAGYFYLQLQNTTSQLSTAQADLDSSQATATNLRAQLKTAQAAKQEAAANTTSSEYRTIPELDVRFKASDATKDIIFGFTASTSDASASSVALSTKTLAVLTVANGASATYPCAFTGNVPIITKYSSDAQVGTSTASKVGKKIGNAYFVYTAPTGNCAPNEVAAQTARNTAAKAIYDALEAVPTATTSSSTANSATQSNN